MGEPLHIIGGAMPAGSRLIASSAFGHQDVDIEGGPHGCVVFSTTRGRRVASTSFTGMDTFMKTSGKQNEDDASGNAPPNEMAEAAAGWARYAAWTSSRAMQAAKDVAELSNKSAASAKLAQEKISILM